MSVVLFCQRGYTFRSRSRSQRSRTTNINASIVDLRVTGIVDANPEWFPWPDENKRKSAAFVVLCMSEALGFALDECAEMLTEGGNDAGVDGLYMSDVEGGEFFVTIFQGRYKVKDLGGTANFPENGVHSALNATRVLFDPDRPVVLNERIAPKIAEVRSFIQDGYLPTVRVVLCNNGARWTDQANTWIHEAEQEYRDQLEFLHFNHDAIVRSMQRGKRIDATLMLNGKAIIEDMNFMRVLVGRLAVQEVGRLFDEYGERLLQRNIRRFLGHANRVNADIRNTLLDQDRSDRFYFYNNGITLVCDRFDYNAFQSSDYQVQLKNVQVINGGQTCKTIQRTLKENGGQVGESAYVMARIYQLPDESDEVVQEITKATNSQSPVDLRDLRSNDEVQRTLELGIKDLGFSYKRHREEGSSGPEIITSATVAEAVLAIWRRRPHQAKYRRREHFGRLYDLIFKDLNATQAVVATLIYRAVEKVRKEHVEGAPSFLPYASHHLSMIVGHSILRDLPLEINEISHRDFDAIRTALQENGERYHAFAIVSVSDALRACYGDRDISLQQLAATFRRGDLLEMLNADGPALA